jgi:hypothetical protein
MVSENMEGHLRSNGYSYLKGNLYRPNPCHKERIQISSILPSRPPTIVEYEPIEPKHSAERRMITCPANTELDGCLEPAPNNTPLRAEYLLQSSPNIFSCKEAPISPSFSSVALMDSTNTPIFDATASTPSATQPTGGVLQLRRESEDEDSQSVRRERHPGTHANTAGNIEQNTQAERGSTSPICQYCAEFNHEAHVLPIPGVYHQHLEPDSGLKPSGESRVFGWVRVCVAMLVVLIWLYAYRISDSLLWLVMSHTSYRQGSAEQAYVRRLVQQSILQRQFRV